MPDLRSRILAAYADPDLHLSTAERAETEGRLAALPDAVYELAEAAATGPSFADQLAAFDRILAVVGLVIRVATTSDGPRIAGVAAGEAAGAAWAHIMRTWPVLPADPSPK